MSDSNDFLPLRDSSGYDPTELRTHLWMCENADLTLQRRGATKWDIETILRDATVKIERIPRHNQGRARDYFVRLIGLGMTPADAIQDVVEVYGNVQSQ